MPYIEREATIELFGEIIEVPLLIKYERHNAIPAIPGGYGEPLIIPAEDAYCEILSIKIITRYGKANKAGYIPPKFEPADWLAQFMTDDQRGEIENAILEELE